MGPGTDHTASNLRRFEFVRCLGVGGFGEVYLAHMTNTSGVRTEVAVKLLHEQLDPQSQALARLRDEAHLLALLRHPSIVRIHDLIVLDGRGALVTEYIEGCDLDQAWLGADPLPIPASLEVVGMVASALDAAYNASGPDGSLLRLVHRDVKPANIRIGQHGEVKLLDFGIARAASMDREARTQTHAMIGSLLYMSPERVVEEGVATPAADVFSLGCTLYEGIAGKRLFDGIQLREQVNLMATPARFDAYVRERLRLVEERIPFPLVELLSRSVAYHSADRPTAAEFATACDDLARNVPGRGLRQWSRGHRFAGSKVVRGPLDGRTLIEAPAVARTVAPTPAPVARASKLSTRGGDAPILPVHTLPLVDTAVHPRMTNDLLASVETLETPPPPPTRRVFPIVIGASMVVILASILVFGLSTLGVFGIWWSTDGGTAPIAAPAPASVRPATPAPAPVEAVAPEPVVEVPAPVEVPPVVSPPVVVAAPLVAPIAVVAAPAPAPIVGATVEVIGSAAQLHRGAESLPPGPIPAGTWEVWADFGDGFAHAHTITVPESGRVVVKCIRMRQVCKTEP